MNGAYFFFVLYKSGFICYSYTVGYREKKIPTFYICVYANWNDWIRTQEEKHQHQPDKTIGISWLLQNLVNNYIMYLYMCVYIKHSNKIDIKSL